MAEEFNKREEDPKVEKLVTETAKAIVVESLQSPDNGLRLDAIAKEVAEIRGVGGPTTVQIRRRRTDDHRVDSLIVEVAEIRTRQTEFGKQLAFNSDVLELIKKNTNDIVEVWDAIHGGVKVLNWLGIIAKWVAIVAGCVAAVGGAYFTFRNGVPGIGPKG